MAITVYPVNAVTGAPAYSGRMLRQALGAVLGGATTARPLGARSGVRPGTPTNTITATSTTWTCKPHAGVIDGEAAVEAGAYWYAVDANVTGSVTAANATNPRKDIVYARVSDPAESDGSSAPAVEILYLAGTAAASPTPPATPARSMLLAIINVPQSGGGSPTVTWSASYVAAAGSPIVVRNTTERAAACTALGPSAENPLFFYRADAATSRRYEYTYDGTVFWRIIASAEVDTVIGLSYANANWGTYTGVFPAPGWRKDAEGFIHFEGAIQYQGTTTTGAVGTIFTLPAGARPGGLTPLLLQKDGTATIRGDIDVSGNLLINTSATWTQNASWLSLNNIAPFKAIN